MQPRAPALNEKMSATPVAVAMPQVALSQPLDSGDNSNGDNTDLMRRGVGVAILVVVAWYGLAFGAGGASNWPGDAR